MKYDFSNIDNFIQWKEKQGKRFRSITPRAITYQNKKYEKEYYWPIIEVRNIPKLIASFYLVYGSAGIIDNLIPKADMLSFIATAEEYQSLYHQPVVLSTEKGIEYKK